MSDVLFVITPSPLARELIFHFQQSSQDRLRVLSYGSPVGLSLPEDSLKVVKWPSYFSFLKYLRNNEFSHVCFAANLVAYPTFWAEAFIDGRIFRQFRQFQLPDVQFLLSLVREDLRNIEIIHPHEIDPPAFSLEENDQVAREACDDVTPLISNYVKITPVRRSFLIVRESFLLGIRENGEVFEIGPEATSTDALIAKLGRIDKTAISRVVLYKTGADPSYITYPVVGERTVELCHRYGVTDIVLDVDSVIQGKSATARLAKSYNISLKRLF